MPVPRPRAPGQPRLGTPRGSGPRGARRRPQRRTAEGPGRRGARLRGGGAAGGLRRPRLTSRAAVLVLVLAVLAVSYASSLRAYLEQRDHVASLRDRIARSEENIGDLQREKRRWRDDAYVVSQARARFAFGFPGEIGFQVLDEDGEPLDLHDGLSDPAPEGDATPEWWQTTLTSLEVAGNPPKRPEPAAKITAPAAPEQDR